MDLNSLSLTVEQLAAAKSRRLEAMRVQEIEGNPLDAADAAMFEMFEREKWSPDQCRAYILTQARTTAPVPAE